MNVMRDRIFSIDRPQQDLGALVFVFNCCPTRYLDQSWHQEFSVTEQAILNNPSGQTGMNHLVLARFADGYHFDFGPHPLRLALLPPRALERLIFYAGLMAMYPYLARAIDQKTRQQIERDIGIKAIQFVLTRAPLIGMPPIILRTPHYSKEDVQRIGLDIFSQVAANFPSPVQSRLRLKLPRGQSGQIPSSAKHDSLVTAPALIRLVRQVVPWSWLFR